MKKNKSNKVVDVRDLEEALSLHPSYDAVVSVIGDDDSVKGICREHHNHIVEVMDDYGKSSLSWQITPRGTVSPHQGCLPRKEQFERILGFVDGLPEDAKILVHCAAGISRSTATGLMILVNEGWDSEEAVEHLKDRHPEGRGFWPNDLILSHADEILGTNLESTVYGGSRPRW